MTWVTLETAASALDPVVSVADLKAHAKVEHAFEDAVLAEMIAVATAHLEGRDGVLGGLALVRQTWRERFPAFGRCMRLAMRDQAEIASIGYRDADDAGQVIADLSAYEVRRDALGEYIVAPDDAPATATRPDAVEVVYHVGWATAADVPRPLVMAVKFLAAHWIKQREAATSFGAAPPTPIPFGVRSLTAPFRQVRV